MRQLTELDAGQPRSLAGSIHIGPAYDGPFTNPELELLGWRTPAFLTALYARGRGIGPWHGGWLPYAFRPWEAVEPLTRRIRFGEENICFDPADCILVVEDDRGGGWVLEGRHEPVWRRFDGDDHSLGPALSDRAVVAAIVSHWLEPA